MKTRIIISAVAIAISTQAADAKVKMPAMFSDGMVLQQDSEVPVWGTSDKKNKEVTVSTSWNGKEYRTKTDKSGKFRVKVETAKYGGPYSIMVYDGDKLTLDNVLLGEVWLCSGQSNMDMRMAGRYGDPVLGALDAVVTSANPGIRMFTVGSKMTDEPLDDCRGKWEVASSETVPHFSAPAYYFARKLNEVLGIPVGILHASYGGSRVEAWMSNEAAAPYKEMPEVKNASILYNGMMSPLVGYGIRGCLWYQGESNVDQPDLYQRLFPDMVKDWREKWDVGEFPIIYAQIAPNKYNKGEGKGKNSAYQREAQEKCLELIPSSGMITLMDVGSSRTIHPMEKETVGKRFAYQALEKVYGFKGFSSVAPKYKSMTIEGDKVTLLFDNGKEGLTSYRKPLTGFEIAGADGVFHPASASFGKGMASVIVSSKDVPNPVAVRYCFKDYDECCLFSLWGIPLSSFRTDNWD